MDQAIKTAQYIDTQMQNEERYLSNPSLYYLCTDFLNMSICAEVILSLHHARILRAQLNSVPTGVSYLEKARQFAELIEAKFPDTLQQISAMCIIKPADLF